MAKGFLFGCDPEVFILDKKGKPVPAALAGIPGTKVLPHRVTDGTVQVDGLAAEIGINPARTFAEFNNRIVNVLAQLQAMLPEGHTLAYVPYVIFEPEAFDSAPDEDKELGCQPDFDAWTGECNPPPEFLENPYLRTASGHLHLGWKTDKAPDFDLTDEQHILNCRDLVKQLDWHLGGWSLKLDKDPMRRNLYGKAGAYRPKPYGVEYRVLSNFWLDNENRRRVVWERMQNAISDMVDRFMPEIAAEDNQALVAAINSTTRSPTLEAKYHYPLADNDDRRRKPYRIYREAVDALIVEAVGGLAVAQG